MRFDIFTLFPDLFPPVLGCSIPRIAAEKGLAEYHLHDIRDFGQGNYRRVDDRPFGGGPGMIMKPEPVFESLESVLGEDHAAWPKLVLLSPQGKRYDQATAESLAGESRLALLCGHYEGFDERIVDGGPGVEVSIGDYVLSGGELAALVVVDSVVRLLPGVLGDAESACHESFSTGRLDHPHYTRPVEFRGMVVPDVLRSGDHAQIDAWRRREALEKTRRNRPDLLDESSSTDQGRPEADRRD